MRNKIFAGVVAVAAGAAWTVLPAYADDTVGQKIDRAIDKTKEKVGEAKDTVQDKASEAKDKIESTTHRAKDKADDSAEHASTSDTASDKATGVVGKTKAKAAEIKDKVMAKTVDRATDADIRAAQMSLKDKGFDPGPADGKLGPRTISALRSFQQREGLKVNGRLDNETKARLSAAASTTPPTPSASPSTVAPSTTPGGQK